MLAFRKERPAAYRAAFDRALVSLRLSARRIANEAGLARLLVDELGGRDPNQRWVIAHNDRRYHRLEVCDLLIEQSLRLVPDQPDEAKQRVELALTIAQKLESPAYSPGLIQDVQARCWASLANTHRALGESPRALDAFRQAGAHLAGGSGDPLEEGQLLELQALLLGELGQLDTAERLLEQQITSYRQLEQHGSTARALAHKAALEARRGHLRQAIELYREAFYGLDWWSHRALAAELRRQLFALLDTQGNDLEMRRELRKSRPFDRRGADEWAELERRRLAARAGSRVGLGEVAAHPLARVAERFSSRGEVADSLRARIDLAELLVRSGQLECLPALREQVFDLLEAPETGIDLAVLVGGLSQALVTKPPSLARLAELRLELALVQIHPERLFALGL